MTGGRDSACRVWKSMRTKLQAMCLTGHVATVGARSRRQTRQILQVGHGRMTPRWRSPGTLAAGKCHDDAVRIT